MNDEICPDCKNQLDDCRCTPYINPSELDIFATPNKFTRKRVKFVKVDYQPKIDLGIDLNDIPDEDDDSYISPSELDMEIPSLWSFTKHVKLTKIESKPIIDLGDDFFND